MPKAKVYYHFTSDTLRDGKPIPPKGKWLVFDGEPILCKQGLHASPTAWGALQYAPGNLLHKVHLGGTIISHGKPIDKYAAQKRKIIASIDATEVMRSFARRCALDVIHLWDAPDIVKQYLETGHESLRAAAWAAASDTASDVARAAAWAAAWAASDAARAAAWAASDAAWAAGDAAWAAAGDAAGDAASAAAWAASDAAGDAASAAAWAKYAKWFNEMIKAEFRKRIANA